MFRDFMNNDCSGGNDINKFTNNFFDKRIGSQQVSFFHYFFFKKKKFHLRGTK